MLFFFNKKLQKSCLDSENIKIKAALAELNSHEFSPGRNPHPLAGCKHPIYTLYIDDTARLIYATHPELKNAKGECVPIVLEFDEKHQYASNYDEMYERFIGKNLDNLKQQILAYEAERKPVDTSPTPYVRSKTRRIGNQNITLDDNQFAVKSPAIVEGPPGSGKTCVAYALIEDFAAQKAKDKKVLYVTRSQQLANNVKAQWAQSPYFDKDNQDAVQILSYKELLNQIYPGLQFEEETEAAIIQSILNAPGVIAAKNKKREDRAQLLYQEFRIISGYLNKNDYLSASDNITRHPKDDRKNILEAYEKWSTDCASKNIRFASFYQIDTTVLEKFDQVYVDEAQDLSYVQLRNLRNLAQDDQVVYFNDPKQNLNDNNAKIVYLQHLFYENNKTIKPIKLEASYRCPPKIMSLAKIVDNMRHAVVPGGKQEAQIQINDSQEGEISWLDTNNPTSSQTIENLKHDAGTCIITTQEHKAALFAAGFSRVFTPSEIKGLQYKTVILYQLVDKNQKIYRDINIALASENRSDQFAPVLSEIFTSITRAENKVIFYQSENESTQNILTPLKRAENIDTLVSDAIEINQAESLRNAQKLYQEGNHQQAIATLQNEVFGVEKNRDALVSEQINEWTPQKETLLDTVNKNMEDITQIIRDEKALSILIKQPRQMHTMLNIIYKTKNLELLDIIISHPDAAKIDWNYRCEKIGALHLVCQTQTEQTIRLAKILINEFKIDINVKSNAKSELNLFYHVLTQQHNELARIFLLSERYDHKKFMEHFPGLIGELQTKMLNLFVATPHGIFNSFMHAFRSQDREQFSGILQRIIDGFESNENNEEDKIYILKAVADFFLREYHHYKNEKNEPKMQIAQRCFNKAKKHIKKLIPEAELNFSSASSTISSVTIRSPGEGSHFSMTQILNDLVALINIMDTRHPDHEEFFTLLTNYSNTLHLKRFLKNKNICFKNYFLRSGHNSFLIERLCNCFLKRIASDEIVDFFEEYHPPALYKLGKFLLEAPGGRGDSLLLIMRAATANPPFIPANTDLALIHEEAANVQLNPPKKIEHLAEALFFAERGSDAAKSSIPRLQMLLDQAVLASNNASSHTVAGLSFNSMNNAKISFDHVIEYLGSIKALRANKNIHGHNQAPMYIREKILSDNKKLTKTLSDKQSICSFLNSVFINGNLEDITQLLKHPNIDFHLMIRSHEVIRKNLLTGLFAVYIDKKGVADSLVREFIARYSPSSLDNLKEIVERYNDQVKDKGSPLRNKMS